MLKSRKEAKAKFNPSSINRKARKENIHQITSTVTPKGKKEKQKKKNEEREREKETDRISNWFKTRGESSRIRTINADKDPNAPIEGPK